MSQASISEQELSLINDNPLFPNSGANFCTHKLQKNSSLHFSIDPTGYSKLFSWCVIGLGALGILCSLFVAPSLPSVFGLLGSAIVVAVGFHCKRALEKITEFNIQARNIKLCSSPFKLNSSYETIRFSEIKALQLLSKDLSDPDINFNCFELNLILNNNSRYNILNHSNLEQLKSDGYQIAKLLNVAIVDQC